MGMNDTINNLWLEIGNSDSFNNGNIPFKVQFLFVKEVAKPIGLLTSEYARHDLDNNIIF